MRYNGFYRRRRGILEHLEAGRVSLFDAGVHDFLCLNAQSRVGTGSAIPPGIWIGSARKIHFFTGRQDSERRIQRSLAKLEAIGWIKRWRKQGLKGDYPILISRFVVRDDARNDFLINAEETTDWRHPALIPYNNPGSDVSVKRQSRDGEASAFLQEMKNGKNNRGGGRPLFQRLVDYAYQAYRERQGYKPSWTGEDFKALKELLLANPELTEGEFQQVFQNYLGSTTAFYQQQGWRLKYCCTDFDGLRTGPKHQRSEEEGSRAEDRTTEPRDCCRSCQKDFPRGTLSEVGECAGCREMRERYFKEHAESLGTKRTLDRRVAK